MKKTIDGLVLREVVSGDSDKVVTMLTASEGKLIMTAKGARSAKSKIAAVCRPFTYGNFEYYEKYDRRWISGGSMNRCFYNPRADIEDFALSAYVAQIAEEISGEAVEAERILRMTLNTLHCIEKKQKPLWQIKAVYELFAAVESGFAPDLSGCCRCGADNAPHGWLDVMNGCFICEECLRKQTGNLPLPELDAYNARNILVPLSPDAVVAMRYVSEAPLSRIFAFTISDEIGRESFARAAETYLLNHLERDFEALRFFKTVAANGRTCPVKQAAKPEAASRDSYNEKQEKV